MIIFLLQNKSPTQRNRKTYSILLRKLEYRFHWLASLNGTFEVQMTWVPDKRNQSHGAYSFRQGLMRWTPIKEQTLSRTLWDSHYRAQGHHRAICDGNQILPEQLGGNLASATEQPNDSWICWEACGSGGTDRDSRGHTRLENNFVDLLLSFYLDMGFRTKLRSLGTCGKCSYLLSHLVGPLIHIFVLRYCFHRMRTFR